MRFTQLLRVHIKGPELSAVKQQYVPKHQPPVEKDIKRLQDFLMDKPNIVVLTGAGISTESGKMTNTKEAIPEKHLNNVTDL